ncbi:hypothetical protein BGX38DRAFT_1142885 [Terfezia claveryi]|nr:hypothetical protein BGX38DRAFT_1142885 [Terfezia claveryi]
MPSTASLSMAHSRQATSSILKPNSPTTVNNQPQQFLRSRSPSPRPPTHRATKAYAVIGATECGMVIGRTPSKSLRSAHSTYSTSERPARYISPFISTKSRPSLYQRAVSDCPGTSADKRGRNRSRSAAGSPVASAPLLSTPSYAGAMIPPFSGYQRPKDEKSRGDSDTSSRCSSRASTIHSTTTSNPSGKRSFVAKLKSVLKGGETTETNTSYLMPEEARDREIRIKKAFHRHPISTRGI